MYKRISRREGGIFGCDGSKMTHFEALRSQNCLCDRSIQVEFEEGERVMRIIYHYTIVYDHTQ